MSLSGLSLEARDALRRRSLAVGAAAFALSAAGAIFSLEQFFRSYLLAYLFWIALPLGCWAILMLHHLVGGAWGFIIQRLLESSVRTFPWMALLFLPVLLGMTHLYPWARPEVMAAHPVLREKSLYLNIPFFSARAAVYFAVWISVAHFLGKWSAEQDRTAQASLTGRLQNLSGPGLVLYGLTVSFSAIDWVMSLEPLWSSTIYGMMFMVGDGLAALAFVIAVAFLLAGERPLAQVVAPEHFHDLGNLLFAFVLLWAYMVFSQFLLVWVENLREEIPWYLSRTAGGWQGVALALALFQFALPFALLLLRTAKRHGGLLSIVALLILLMRWVDLFWLIAPAFHPGRFDFHWMDITLFVAIGGIWFAAFFTALKQRSLLPLHDPRFAEIAGHAQKA